MIFLPGVLRGSLLCTVTVSGMPISCLSLEITFFKRVVSHLMGSEKIGIYLSSLSDLTNTVL